MNIDAVMTPCPFTISTDASLDEALRTMTLQDIRHLPVVDGGSLVGIVSERDARLSKLVCETTHYCPTVGEICVGDPFVVLPDTNLATAANEMATQKIECALVVDAEGIFKGIFTTIDAFRALHLILGEQES